jgi:hypothetical protein
MSVRPAWSCSALATPSLPNCCKTSTTRQCPCTGLARLSAVHTKWRDNVHMAACRNGEYDAQRMLIVKKHDTLTETCRQLSREAHMPHYSRNQNDRRRACLAALCMAVSPSESCKHVKAPASQLHGLKCCHAQPHTTPCTCDSRTTALCVTNDTPDMLSNHSGNAAQCCDNC